ncbi:DUF5318 family protein [Corynebacterium kroppenstedtii]|uniref:DUF5318 family protein n=1 Tax=Corynebacterium sp. PCR 32 TaxID=3351342 RepID=UPI003099BC39
MSAPLYGESHRRKAARGCGVVVLIVTRVSWIETKNHELDRQRLLAEYRRGEISAADLRQSSRWLIGAADFHGEPQDRRCPLCGKMSLKNVVWIFGDNLGKIAGTARSRREVDALAATYGDITAHIVEVCVHCRWNVLLREMLVDAESGASEPRVEEK